MLPQWGDSADVTDTDSDFPPQSVKFYLCFFLLLIVVLNLTLNLKGALDKFNIIPQLFPKKVGIFIPLEGLAWVMTACRVLRSRLTYFWRYMNISSIFYFSKSTSINTQYSSLWNTLKMMLFTKYLIKRKCIGRISWNFWYELIYNPLQY